MFLECAEKEVQKLILSLTKMENKIRLFYHSKQQVEFFKAQKNRRWTWYYTTFSMCWLVLLDDIKN